MRRTALAQLAVIIVSGLLLAALPAAAAEMTPADAPPAYVGSESCTACHRAEAKAWKGSHHGLAWTAPTPENVRADFDGTEFSQGDMTARFRIEPDGSYHVTVTETDGVTTDYRVHSVAGVYPLQQYLLETEPGRLQSFDVVWDSEKGGWFSLSPDGPFAPDDGMHWTGPYKNWNGRCAECHATGFVKNYDATAHTFASTEAEIGVGCEACHGPGSAHAAWASGPRKSRGTPPPNYGFSVDFSDREATLEQCATCHSRREPHFADEPLPGTPFHDSYNLSLLMPGLYQADGQILDEVYVYGSFLQSKMHAKGVTCLDCHEPHSATLRAEGNAVCAQCHNPAGNTAFPSLRLAEYDSPEHHFHEPGTPGSECKNCHMVERVYMGNDWRADHSLRVPRPDLDAVTGAPDACTTCHTGETPEWAAAQITEWYPESTHRGPHYGETMAQGLADPVAAAGELITLAFDPERPGIVRATALWILGQSGSPEAAEAVEPLLRDPDPVVRAAAVDAQRMAAPPDRVPRLVASLSDPIRSVRISAARAMIDAPIAHMPDAMEAARRQATEEWQAAMAGRLDFPETHLQLGGVALVLRDPVGASAAFREAVRMDPQLVQAWSMVVRIAALTGNSEEARAALEEALAANPGDASLEALRAQIP